MNVASLVIRVLPAKMAALREALGAIPGTEIHAETGDGRMIVTVEDMPDQRVSEALARIQQLEAVICITLAYEHSETEELATATSAPVTLPADAGWVPPESIRKFQEA